MTKPICFWKSTEVFHICCLLSFADFCSGAFAILEPSGFEGRVLQFGTV
jgi:hypothetical protein